MAMDWQTSNEFEKIMSEGKSWENNAESYERQTYYSDAKSRYMNAVVEYGHAERLAKEHDDYRYNEACRRKDHCRSKVSEMVEKQWKKEQEYLNSK